MNNREARLLVFLLALAAPGISAADKLYSGSLRGSDYTAPDKSFQCKVPRLIDPGAFVRDIRVSDDIFKVVMGDELCRRAFVVQYAATRFPDFDAFTRDREAALGLQNANKQVVHSSLGEVTLTTGKMPDASTCMVMTLDAEGRMVPSPGEGSDAASILIAGEDAYYELGYLVGAGGAFADMYGIGNAEEVLEGLLAGFKITGPRLPAKLPDTVMLLRFIDEESAAQCTSLGRIKGKSKSMSLMASIDSHVNSAKAKLRKQALKLGANAIVVRESELKTSGLTGSPYMAMAGEAMKCETVPQYLAWELPAAD